MHEIALRSLIVDCGWLEESGLAWQISDASHYLLRTDTPITNKSIGTWMHVWVDMVFLGQFRLHFPNSTIQDGCQVFGLSAPICGCFLCHNDGSNQHDNAPNYTVRIVKEWFEEHFGEFLLKFWPQNSPDINPVKHLWLNWEKQVCATLPPPHRTKSL